MEPSLSHDVLSPSEEPTKIVSIVPDGAKVKKGDLICDLDSSSLREQSALQARATLEAFPAAVTDYQSGKKAAIGRLIGETIKRTGGRANPDQVRRILEAELDAR